ncbi:sporulation inhibitor of replication protein SirA [Sutcliffiella cohnii]
MRQYTIYLMKEEIVEYYLGQEYKLFQLFQEYEQSKNLQPIIKKQIEYITLPIQEYSLSQLLKQTLSKRKDYAYKGHEHTIWIPKVKSSAKLSLYENYIELSATGSFEAESILFEVIRKDAPYYLAIDIKAERYGWLQPIKQRNFV